MFWILTCMNKNLFKCFVKSFDITVNWYRDASLAREPHVSAVQQLHQQRHHQGELEAERGALIHVRQPDQRQHVQKLRHARHVAHHSPVHAVHLHEDVLPDVRIYKTCGCYDITLPHSQNVLGTYANQACINSSQNTCFDTIKSKFYENTDTLSECYGTRILINSHVSKFGLI